MERRFMLPAKRIGGFLSVIRFVLWQDTFAALREQPMKSNIHPGTSVRRDNPRTTYCSTIGRASGG